jgi:ERCC4-related helicase
MFLANIYFDIPSLYYSEYHSEMNACIQKDIIQQFEASKFGIITCVYCLSEGWDFPLLDGVVFAENMTSNIRIVQSALRASRKNKHSPDKITKIILPILNRYNWMYDSENTDLKKVRNIIHQMSLEDETITEKIRVIKISIGKHTYTKYSEKVKELNIYDIELTKNLILQTTKRISFGISFNKAKQILADKNIRSKEEYYKLCDEDIRLSKEPEILYKGQFTNWIDYFNIEQKYYTLTECKERIKDLRSVKPELFKSKYELFDCVVDLCHYDNKFPPQDLWTDYYKVFNLQELFDIQNVKKSRRKL